jgi:hypothetical protein
MLERASLMGVSHLPLPTQWAIILYGLVVSRYTGKFTAIFIDFIWSLQ